MIKIENECVDCPKEIGCIGDLCPYKNVTRYYCDYCEQESELYNFDGEELCEDCARARLKECFDDYTLEEQAEILGLDLSKV